MSYMIRKFSRGKWEPHGECPADVSQLSADALTSCLRTSGNTLSLWQTESSDWGEFDDVLAAICSTLDGPSRVDLVLLPEDEVCTIKDVQLANVMGCTAANDEINQKHYDIKNLKHSSISEFAELVIETLRSDKADAMVKRFNEKSVLRLVKHFIDQGKLDPGSLSDRWREKLGISERK